MRGSVDLHVHLLARGVAHEFFRLEHRVRSAEDAISGLGVTPDQFGLAQVVLAPTEPIALAVTAAGAPVDLPSLSRCTGKTGLRLARPAAAARITGFPTGWIPPVSLEEGVGELLDAVLAESDVIYGPGGEPGLLVGLRTADLLATGAVVARVAMPIGSMR